MTDRERLRTTFGEDAARGVIHGDRGVHAVAADGDNPDYLFNLAVSLDHLRQPRLAAQHYRLALEASTKRPAAFERDQVRKRLGELQPERQAEQQP